MMIFNMRKKNVLRRLFVSIFPVLIFVILITAGPVLSATGGQGDAEVKDIVVIEKSGELLVFGSLRNVFSSKLLEAIHSGVTTEFIFDLSLVRSRKLIHDLVISSRTLHHQVAYSALKKTYTFVVKEGAKDIKRKVTKSKDEMMDGMGELNGIPVASAKAMSPGGLYYVKIRARVSSVDLVFPFNYLLALWRGASSDWSYSPGFRAKGM